MVGKQMDFIFDSGQFEVIYKTPSPRKQRSEAFSIHSVMRQRVCFPGTISPRQAIEILTNGHCGD